MPSNKPNPAEGYDAVIVFDSKGTLQMVVPEEFSVDKDEPVKWLISPEGNYAKVVFDSNHTPFKWDNLGDNKEIKGETKKTMKGGDYKYSVTDTDGTITIDPRIRVGRA